jgi:putative ABC transport system permease protein
MFDRLGQDIGYTVRGLRRTPGFAAAALVTLALGIGANTAVFSVVYGVLLRPLPFPDPDRLVMLHVQPRDPNPFNTGGAVSPGAFLDWQARGSRFDGMAAFSSQSLTLTGGGEPELLTAAAVTVRFFDTLRVRAAVGRTFIADEGMAGRSNVAVLSHALWRRRFGADPAIVGRSVTLDGRAVTVVGVMPEGFSFPEEALGPSGRFRSIQRVELWTPFAPQPGDRGNAFLRMFARVPAAIPLAQAQREMTATAQALGATLPASRQMDMRLVPLHEYVTGDAKQQLLLLFGAVALVLLIACVNVANLLVARAAARQKEVAMRAALGATRGRLIRQFLTESTLLGVLGGGCGLLLAAAGLRAFVGLIPRGSVPRLAEVTVDVPILAFTGIVSIAAGMIFGLAPVLHTRRTGIGAATRGLGSAQTTRLGLLHGLVATEVALAVVLLTGAGLLIASFLRLNGRDPGFDPADVTSASVRLPGASYPTIPAMYDFHTQVLNRLSMMPGVIAAGAINWLPFGGDFLSGDLIVESGTPPGFVVLKPAVSARYFRVMDIPLMSGRFFTDADTAVSAPVVIVTDGVARRLWDNRNPLGRRLKMGFGRAEDQRWATVVGVVGDVKQNALSDAEMPSVYMALSQVPQPFLLNAMTYVVRTAPDDERGAPALRAAIRAADPNLPISRMLPVGGLIAGSLAEPRFRSVLFGVFAAIAVALVITGLLGVLTYSVTRRTKEIGLRVALGAAPAAVARLVVRQGLTVTVIGLAAGLAGALALTRLMDSVLFAIEPDDPGVLALVALCLVTVALVASYLPARRAARVDPIVALGHD